MSNRVAVMLVAGVAAVTVALGAEGVAISDVGGKLRVEIGGELFTEYHYKDVARPYMYPIIGPGGVGMTRDWPMKENDNDVQDHVHHKGLWYAHGKVNDVDCWSEQKAFGKTIHEKFLETTSGAKQGVIRSLNKWVTADGKPLCSDERTIRFYPHSDVRMLDFEITFIASEGDLTLGDTKEGSMSIRLPTSMSVKAKGKVAEGHIINSKGERDVDAWGKRAEWVDYYGPVNGKPVAVAMFDHPKNPRHPTHWHVRDYGLFSANPYGIHDFTAKDAEKQPAGAGDLKVAAGKKVTFRYRFLFHTGDEKEGKVAEHYKKYAATKTAK
ncbi:MAG: PmoA family protein [Verrucomicrobia bacterium]|nr:PmoA family protein [Verrucomicrobiota bacterium]